MAKVVEFNQVGGPEVLSVVERDMPTPSENEVVVQVKVAGLNRAEQMFFRGQYLFQPAFPSSVGLEASGVIHSISEGVTDFEVGEEVCLTPNIKPTEYGFLGEYVKAPISAVIKKPQGISFDQAAAVWMTYGTAYGSLVFRGGLEKGKGQTVLVSAASSAVGVAAIQVAKSFGAKVIATTRTSAKKDFLLQQDADYVIATEEENLAEKVMEYTDNQGFNIAIDPIAGEFVNTLAEAAAPEASIVIYGILSMQDTPMPLFPLMVKGISVSGFHLVFHVLEQETRFKEVKENILEGLESGTYQPTIDENSFTLDEVVKAYEFLEPNQQKGKILVKIGN